MVWVKLRWLEPTRHKRGLLGGCDAHAGGETSVGSLGMPPDLYLVRKVFDVLQLVSYINRNRHM
jgi:hypothetical protein